MRRPLDLPVDECAPDRKLSGPEIELVVHLLKVGAAATPVRILSGGTAVAGQLRRLGLIDLWYKQTLSSRLDGPFYSLTRIGTFRAEALLLARRRAATPPPPTKETDHEGGS